MYLSLLYALELNMSNWRVFSESQDEEPDPEYGFELSLSQLPEQPISSVVFSTLQAHSQQEAGSSRPPKQPRIEQRWHGNLQHDARALVILLQVGRVEPNSREVTFEGCFEGLNEAQYFCMAKPVKGSRGHQRWLEGPVNPLTKADRAKFVATTVKRILEFLQME